MGAAAFRAQFYDRMCIMPEFRYRLIDTAGGVIGISSFDRPSIVEGDTVRLPDGTEGTVVEVYDDDEHGKEGGVVATLVVEEP
jgi:hypothetical protein